MERSLDLSCGLGLAEPEEAAAQAAAGGGKELAEKQEGGVSVAAAGVQGLLHLLLGWGWAIGHRNLQA